MTEKNAKYSQIMKVVLPEYWKDYFAVDYGEQ